MDTAGALRFGADRQTSLEHWKTDPLPLPFVSIPHSGTAFRADESIYH
jgi:hypothetical protein